jgi:putative zinc finger protein
MICSRVRDLLPDYSVELLDARAHREVETHLAMCEECRRELKLLDQVVSLVEAHGVRQPPVGLFNGVRNRIESGAVVRERAPWWAWFYTGPARAAAMGMAVAALALGIFLPTNPGPDLSGIRPPTDPTVTPGRPSSALVSSVRQHAMSAAEGPLADRVAWEAMAQLVTQEKEAETAPGVE